MDKFNDELYHHGVLGMRWGVRNAETRARYKAEKAYSSGNDKKLKRILKRQLHKKRAELNGRGSQWAWSSKIGPNTTSLINDRKRLQEEYYNSKPYKDWLKKYNKHANSEYDDDYDQKEKELFALRPKENFNTLSSAYVVGEGWMNNYHKKGGFDLGVANLKDLGYDDETAKKYIKRFAKNKWVLQ